ncbi:phage integrase N-terminal SAM-like domain-containing protein, partial [Rubrivirga sp.]
MASPSPLLTNVREACRVRRYALSTERAYVDWVRRYCHFHRTPGGASR